MEILTFQFSNKLDSWVLEPLELKKLTLLVGASGVGKSRILKSIRALSNVSKGQAMQGMDWKVVFRCVSGKVYDWSGRFETTGSKYYSVTDTDRKPAALIREQLKQGKRIVFEKSTKGIRFLGKQMPKLTDHQSLMFVFKDEQMVKEAQVALSGIQHTDYTPAATTADFNPMLFEVDKLSKKYKTIEAIRNADIDIVLKLTLCSRNEPTIFRNVVDRYKDIFPQVENIKLAPLKPEADGEIPEVMRKIPFVQIKERGIKQWVPQESISSGMMRTLMQLAQLYLCREGTVFLIDEFENSLGVNCINEVTQDIVLTERDLQFIITSHHPYIINSISTDSWLLVTRKANKVRGRSVARYHFEKSKHDSFIQLLQLPEYQTGSPA